MSTAERIRARRLELGMTQQELADKLGYTSKSSIGKIENGNQELPMKLLKKVAKALQISPQDLIEWKDPEAEEAAQDLRLLALFHSLDSEGQADVMDFLEVKVNRMKKDISQQSAS